MGGVDSWFDDLDEKKVSLNQYGGYQLETTSSSF